MSKAVKDNSTTSRLQLLQTRRIKTALFFSGLFALMLIMFGFCYIQDSAYTGITNPFDLWGTVIRRIDFGASKTTIFPTVSYYICQTGFDPQTVDATPYFYVTVVGIVLMTLLNALVALLSRPFAKTQIRRQLGPLYNMARTTMKLSEQRDGYGEKQIHDLESAIDNIRPETPDAQLRTGDSDLKGLEDAINSLLQRTRDSYSQQIRFVSDASHELRTPIAVIKGYTDMLDRWGKQDEKILDESISAIKTETDHMNRLVEQLLFLARGDSGRTKLNIEEFSLSDMVREVYDESVMIDPKHKWEISAENEVVAVGDAAMLKQATRILVDNAAKYTPEDEKISLKAILDKNGEPTVVVQDNGIGIAQQDMSHIFDRFYRSDPARQQGGTGLGLAIAKWIVDRHGGYFEVLSHEEFGTRISIHLPKPKVP